MAGMKSWLEKIKNRILKKDLQKSKIQSEEKNEKALPDLITPTNEEINKEKDKIQREEAIRVKKNNEREKNQEIAQSKFSGIGEIKTDNIKSSIETRPWWTKRSSPNRWKECG